MESNSRLQLAAVLLAFVAALGSGKQAASGATAREAAGDLRQDEFPRPPSEVREIVFAVRHSGRDPHYYVNFGYFAFDKDRYSQYGPSSRHNMVSQLGLLCIPCFSALSIGGVSQY
jgi:hypothetical protein